MSVLLLPTCPTSCAGSLPAVDFDDCAPELHWGEVSKLYIAAVTAADFTNVELLAEWTTRLSETLTGADTIRELTVLGDLPAPEQTEQAISGDRTAVGFKTFTLPFDIDETNDINYNFLLTYECNMKVKVWYETADGMLYGGNEGIEATLRMDQIIPRERTEIVKFTGSLKWKNEHSPLRCESPMA
jgi:hypothetical protein